MKGAAPACEAPPVANMAGLLGRPLPDNIYGTLTHTFIPSELGRVIPATENYITHMPVTAKGTKFYLVVTDTKIYKISDTLSKKRDVWDMKEIRNIVGTEENVTINLISRVASDDVYLKPKTFEGDAFTCQSLPFIFDNRSRIIWQNLIESKFVPEPEVYQCHFFVAFHENKKKFASCLILSNTTLYVCTLKSGMPAVVKEKFTADKITAIAAIPDNNRAIKVTLGDVQTLCIAADAEDCNALSYELRRLVWDTRRVNIAVQQPPQQ